MTKGEGKRKSLLASAGLSLFGPIGWLYAGSFKETIPAVALYVAIAAVIPTFLLTPLLPVVMPLSAVAGLVYGWAVQPKWSSHADLPRWQEEAERRLATVAGQYRLDPTRRQKSV